MKYITSILLAISVLVALANPADARGRSVSSSSSVTAISRMAPTSYTERDYSPVKALRDLEEMKRPADGGSLAGIYTAAHLVLLNNQNWARDNGETLRDADNAQTYGIEKPMSLRDMIIIALGVAIGLAIVGFLSRDLIILEFSEMARRRESAARRARYA